MNLFSELKVRDRPTAWGLAWPNTITARSVTGNCHSMPLRVFARRAYSRAYFSIMSKTARHQSNQVRRQTRLARAQSG
jgi:hypothetical protein